MLVLQEHLAVLINLVFFLLNSTLAPYERKSRDMEAHIIIAFIHHYSNLLMPSLSTDSNPSPRIRLSVRDQNALANTLSIG